MVEIWAMKKGVEFKKVREFKKAGLGKDGNGEGFKMEMEPG